MVAGKQPETLIVQWHPGEALAKDGFGNIGATIPAERVSADHSYVDNITVSGVVAAIETSEGYTNTLYQRMFASGVVDFGFGGYN